MNADFEAARAAFSAGLLAHQEGRYADAEASYRQSLVHLPSRPSSLTNLGAALIKLGRAAEALPLLDQALAAEPGKADALAHRGVALGALQRHEEALACFAQLLQAGADDAPTWFHHALCLVQLDRPQPALASYQRAVQHDPLLGEAFSHIGGLLKDLGRPAEAVPALQRAIELDTDVAVNQYLLASLTGSAAPPAPPADYVTRLFDAYAPQFDAHLQQRLQYRVPQLLAQQLQASGRRFDAALDLGCGTGLCGPLVKPLVQQLHGVDLSPRMLERAAALGVYHQLLLADIVPHLKSTAQRYELVLAADVFIYLGDLTPVFAGVQRVLQPDGLFCFSVEEAEADQPFVLRASSRYAHGPAHLRALAAQHGLHPVDMQPHTLRLDQGRPVPGLIVTFRQPRAH